MRGDLLNFTAEHPTVKRFAELLTACPELTDSEMERLRGFRPQVSSIGFSVYLAYR